MKPPLTQQHFDCLDGLRAVLALYVVMHHFWMGSILLHPETLNRGFFIFALGRYAVCFFIVLSGFCLALPTLKDDYILVRGFWPYLERRAWRILPPYYFALLLSIVVDLPMNHRTGGLLSFILPVTGPNIISHVLLIHNFLPHHIYKINGAFWSIPIEWQIYFVFPLLLLGWRRLGPVGATLAAVLVSILMELAINHRFNRQPCAHFIGLFALGMLAASIGTSTRYLHVPWRALAIIPWIAFIASFYFNNQVMLDVTFGFAAAITLVIMFLYPNGWLHRGLNWKPLVFIGSFSYSIYLIHAPILFIIWLLLQPWLNAHPNPMCLLLIVAGTPFITAIAYLFHLLCEKPFLRLRGRKIVHIQ